MILRSDLILLSLGRLAGVVIALVSLRVATTFLTPAEYGAWAVLVVFQSLCGLFLINPIGQYINRHTHEWHQQGVLVGKLRRYASYVFFVSMLGAFFYIWWQLSAPMTWQMLALSGALAVMVLTATWNATLIPMLNMLGDRRSTVMLSNLSLGLGLILAWMAVSVYPTGGVWFVSQAIGQAVGAAWAWKLLVRLSPDNRQISTQVFYGNDDQTQTPKSLHVNPSKASSIELIGAKDIKRYCLPLALTTGLMWLQLAGYRLWFDKNFGLTDLAMLTVGIGLANQAFALVETLAMQYVLPHFYQAVSQPESGYSPALVMTDMLALIVPVYLLLSMVVMVLAPSMLMLLTDGRYHAAHKLVVIGVGMEWCRVLSNLLGQAAQVTKRTRSTLPPYATGALVLVAGWWLAGLLLPDLEAAAAWLILVAGATALGMWVCMHREVAFSLRLSNVILASLMLVVVGVMCVKEPLIPHSYIQAIGFCFLVATVGVVVWHGLSRTQLHARRLLLVKLPVETQAR